MGLRDVLERPVPGPGFLDYGHATESVRIVEVLHGRRSLVEFRSGSTMIVPDCTLRDWSAR
jgi:hypothetical protein